MAKYRASKNEGEILPNLLGLTDTAAVGLAEFEGFLRADILLTEALTPAIRFTLPYAGTAPAGLGAPLRLRRPLS